MLYPNFLNTNDKIGVVGLSAGVGDNNDAFSLSIRNIESLGHCVVLTESVTNDGEVSNTVDVRIKELNSLLEDNSIKVIMCACGGDFLYEIIPYVDYQMIKEKCKWFMGASDPASLLYIITTMLDISTIYGFNAGSFDSLELHSSQKYALNMLKGDISTQVSYPFYESNREGRINGNYNLEVDSRWESFDKKVNITGRIIGGCIDCLRYIIGTKYDNTVKFIEKYKDDGIIWYFDIFSMSSEDFYLTLLQMKNIGWFNYIKGVIVGRVNYPSTYTSVNYKEALKKVFDVPVIFNADIGHVVPKMTIINGSVANVVYNNGSGYISQELV